MLAWRSRSTAARTRRTLWPVSWSTVTWSPVLSGVGRKRLTLLFVYRPLSEIDGILADARRMGVRTIWRQPNIANNDRDAVAWRAGVEAVGLAYLDTPDIVEVAQELGRSS